MANGTDDPTADATTTVGAPVLPQEASIASDNTAQQDVVLEYRNTVGPYCVDAKVKLDGPGLPQTLIIDGTGFTLCGTTSDGRPIYGSV